MLVQEVGEALDQPVLSDFVQVDPCRFEDRHCLEGATLFAKPGRVAELPPRRGGQRA